MTKQSWRVPAVVLWGGAFVLCISLGIRHAFGLFLQPMSLEMGWGREAFAFAIAAQNLVWGLSQPFAGRLADRFGAGLIVLGGTLLYFLGLVAMSRAGTELTLIISAGLFIGLGLSGTTFPVVFGAISRTVPTERRSTALGISMAVGSLGQFVLLPGSNTLIVNLGWAEALLVLAGLSALMLLLSVTLLEPRRERRPAILPLGAALAEAGTHRGFWLLSLGFFVCGFQVVFIATHLPAYLVDAGLPVSGGATVLALIGLFNIAGSYLAGHWGSSQRKPLLLSGIYAARLVVISSFLLVPLSTWSAYTFGVAMGLLWLSTVPLTNGTVASIFGVENMSMLAGVVFLFHQLGAFLGGWLGGYLFDRIGSYDGVWMICIGLSVIAALLNLPISERPVARLEMVRG